MDDGRREGREKKGDRVGGGRAKSGGWRSDREGGSCGDGMEWKETTQGERGRRTKHALLQDLALGRLGVSEIHHLVQSTKQARMRISPAFNKGKDGPSPCLQLVAICVVEREGGGERLVLLTPSSQVKKKKTNMMTKLSLIDSSSNSLKYSVKTYIHPPGSASRVGRRGKKGREREGGRERVRKRVYEEKLESLLRLCSSLIKRPLFHPSTIPRTPEDRVSTTTLLPLTHAPIDGVGDWTDGKDYYA